MYSKLLIANKIYVKIMSKFVVSVAPVAPFTNMV